MAIRPISRIVSYQCFPSVYRAISARYGRGCRDACIAVELKLDSEGNKLAHRFTRGLMKSVASLNYTEVQAARDGEAEGRCADLAAGVLHPLFDAYAALRRARDRRAAT